jgi:hypothetical protein
MSLVKQPCEVAQVVGLTCSQIPDPFILLRWLLAYCLNLLYDSVLRPNAVKINRVKYSNNSVIRKRNEDNFVYCLITDIYIHEDIKVFLVKVLDTSVLDHLKCYIVHNYFQNTGTSAITHEDFYIHGTLNIITKNNVAYIVESFYIC